MSINDLSLLTQMKHKYIVVFIILISLLSIYIFTENIGALYREKNSDTLFQGSHTINITVISRTCKGLPLPNNFPIYVKLYENDTKVKECAGVNCTLSNVAVGNYTLFINYKNPQKEELIVYQKDIKVEENSTNFLIEANVNITKIRINIIDDEGVTLKAFSGKLKSIRDNVLYSFQRDTDIYLPLGEYSFYQVIYTFNTKEGALNYVFNSSEINVTTSVTVKCGKNIIAKVPVAHRVIFRFFKVSGEPLIMDDVKARIELQMEDEEHILKEVYLSSSNIIEFSGVPYGKYIVSIYKEGKRILKQDFMINLNNKDIYVYTNIISFLKFRFVDLDGNLLQKYNMTIQSPLKTFHVQTNALGIVELENVIGGTYYIRFSWNEIITISLSEQITTKGLYVIKVPLKTLTITILPEFSDTLPQEIEVSFFYKKDGILIDSYTAQEEMPEIKIEMYQIPIGSEYYVRVKWKNKILNYTRVEILNNTRDIKVYVPLFDVTFKIIDMNKMSLSNTSVKILTPTNNLIELRSNNDGICEFRHATIGDYKITIYWKEVQVYNEIIRIARGMNLTKVIKVEVYDIHLKVYGWFNTPLKDVFLNAMLKMNNIKIKEFNATSLESGDILLLQVPLPKGSNLKIILEYKGKRISDLIVPKDEKGVIEKEYFMDVFIDTPFYALSFLESLVFLIILLGGIFGIVVVYRKLSYKREVSHIFDERLVKPARKTKETELEEFEYSGIRGFYRHLKDFLEELFYHKKEEEDEDMEIFQ
ncbi:MAG: hypothetical protein J7K23_03795 [Thermoproteales archaeon]|nr:hypothetical protein [Thermoproteales archaeon]